MGGRQGAAGISPLIIPIDMVRLSDDHIRKSDFSTEHLKDTIADAGLLQPILVRKDGDRFIVTDGARRLAALRELGVKELIIGRDIVIDTEETEADTRFKQIIANVQRENLSDIELGQAFVTLKEAYGYQYNEIAEIIGKTPHFVAAKVGLVKRLDPEVRRLYLEDLSNEKCTGSTFCTDGGHYVININVLEDIARSPRELQLAAYREIKARQMDQETAIAYLRMLKHGGEGTAAGEHENGMAGISCVKTGRESDLRRCILKIRRNVDRLADTMKGRPIVEPEIDAEIDELIGRLNALRAGANPPNVTEVDIGSGQL